MPSAGIIPHHPLAPRGIVVRSFAALILLVLTLRLTWGWYARRALNQEIQTLRAAGQPVTVADLPFEPVPDAENAWHAQTAAAAALTFGVDSPSNTNLDFADYPPYIPEWWKLAEASEKANANAFALARQALPLTRVQTHGRLQNPTPPPYPAGAHMLAFALGDAALYAHLKTHDDLESLRRLRDMLHVARSLRHDEFSTSQSLANRIEAKASHHLLVIGPGLRPDDLRAPGPLRESVNTLIRQLLDESPARRGATAGLQMEQLGNLDWARASSPPVWLLHPLVELQSLRNAADLQLAIEASRAPTQPQADAILRNLRAEPAFQYNSVRNSPDGSRVPRYSRLFSTGTWLEHYVAQFFRGLAERRFAAVSLAFQLYHADHSAWPTDLSSLVPTYLPALPLDPYHDDGRSIGYTLLHQTDGTPRPLLYVDITTGPPGTPSPFPLYTWQPELFYSLKSDPRQYRDLTRFTPPSPKSVGGNVDESNAPRDQSKY